MPLLLDLYRLTGWILYLLARLLAPVSALFPGRAAYLFSERLGLYKRTQFPLQAPVVWLHAASVGEVQAALLLLDSLRRRFPACRFVLSSTSKQGQELAQSRLPADIACIMAPLDLPQAVKRAAETIRPTLYLCLETELWPLLLLTLARRGVPLLLLNGRLSERSFRRYQKLGQALLPVLRSFRKLALIAEADRNRFAALGTPEERLIVTGDCKFDLPLDDGTGAVRSQIRASLGLAENDRLLLCGSTHSGEEARLVTAYQALRQEMPLVLALAPRHLERLAEVETLLQTQGLEYVRYSALKTGAKRSSAVILVDTMGDLATLYAAGDFLFCGGSLLPGEGGHNVMEAARWGRPVSFGPHMKDWQVAANLLSASGGGFVVRSAEELAAWVRRNAQDPVAYESACRAARETAASQRGALARQMDLVAEFL